MRLARPLLLSLGLVAAVTPLAAGQTPTPPRTGQQVFETICITCHGKDGKAGVNPAIEQVVKPPDFTNCAFANREPSRGFLAVAHGGGPARGFSPLMAPWEGAFSDAELEAVIAYFRGFCTDQRWPRGELNVPLALVTNKAFPEDEALLRIASTDGQITTTFVYERRFGPLNQWEVAVPWTSLDNGAGGRTRGVGDMALGYKRVLSHSLASGHIVSVSGEVKIPTGRESRGLGDGVAVFEPFMTYGQLIGANTFFQAQAGVGLPASRDLSKEVFWRGAIGHSLFQGRFGRMWSPMVEALAARPLETGARVEWDLAPQMQVTLNARQHIRLNAGLRMPVNDRAERPKTVMVYLLWDWYEGGFFKGW